MAALHTAVPKTAALPYNPNFTCSPVSTPHPSPLLLSSSSSPPVFLFIFSCLPLHLLLSLVSCQESSLSGGTSDREAWSQTSSDLLKMQSYQLTVFHLYQAQNKACERSRNLKKKGYKNFMHMNDQSSSSNCIQWKENSAVTSYFTHSAMLISFNSFNFPRSYNYVWKLILYQ